MKLRNKKTGEIHEITEIVPLHDMDKKFAIYSQTEAHNYAYKNLDELNEEWEDVPEKPKEYWHIDFDGSLMLTSDIKCDKTVFDKLKEIGNYFETKEEAEKAVEKLKAWKRLKDKGFRFGHWVTVREKKCGKVEFKCDDIRLTFDEARKFYNDISLLFGGKE